MKRKIENSGAGVSDLIGTILIVILVIGLAAVIAAFLMPNFIQKSVYIASEVRPIPIQQLSGIPVDVIGILPMAGDPFYIIWQPTAYKSGTPVSVRALGPDGVNHTWSKIDLKAGNLYGRQIYIYPPVDTPDPSKCGLCISDQPPDSTKNLIPMEKGRWTIQFVDENVHILVMSNTDGVIKGGSTSRPNAGGMLGDLYDNNCQRIIPNDSSTLGPDLKDPNMNNMTYQSFNGSQFVNYDTRADLNITGDMSISMWFRPSDNSTWHQLVGKGETNSAGSTSADENDNYQIFQLGNKLLFEWNDASSTTHYQAYTNTMPVQANQWNFLAVTVQGGELTIYYNGVAQPLAYNKDNVPYRTPVGKVPVHLMSNDNKLYIGKQYIIDPFPYLGDIGSMGLYNRALTTNEINQSYQTYSA